MHIIWEEISDLDRSIRDEVELSEDIDVGANGDEVRRVQEWLTLHGYGLAIDGDFGPVTGSVLLQFQTDNELEVTGIVNDETFNLLVAPLIEVLTPIDYCPPTFAETVLIYAERHLLHHPLEIGGQNRGPWVRLYMNGHEGKKYPWCAGFVTFVIKQAADTLGMDLPIAGSFSCDVLAAQGEEGDLFVSEDDIADEVENGDMPVASIFLVRKTDDDWTHTGLVTSFDEESFTTIEGNTNDDGDREGYEVCVRTRAYKKKDFIALR